MTYGLLQWNRLVTEDKVTETDLVHREGVSLINIMCPSCGCHMYEKDRVYYREGQALKEVFCTNCQLTNSERLVVEDKNG